MRDTLSAQHVEQHGSHHDDVDRIAEARLLDERFPADSGRLMEEWLALPKDRPDPG